MIRTIVEERSQNIAVMDVFSKLIQERTIFIDSIIDDDLANQVIAQLLYLNAENPKKVINIYINSPGGSVLSGLAIYDVAQNIKSPIRTVCVGSAFSMGAVLMLMGSERCMLKHSLMMIHEVSSGVDGKTKDITSFFEVHKHLQSCILKIIKEKTQIENVEEIIKVDKYYTAEEALAVGLIDKIL